MESHCVALCVRLSLSVVCSRSVHVMASANALVLLMAESLGQWPKGTRFRPPSAARSSHLVFGPGLPRPESCAHLSLPTERREIPPHACVLGS